MYTESKSFILLFKMIRHKKKFLLINIWAVFVQGRNKKLLGSITKKCFLTTLIHISMFATSPGLMIENLAGGRWDQDHTEKWTAVEPMSGCAQPADRK